jgi:hypothetical protein
VPPSRPPDTRDLVTRRQRALASGDSSRYDLANRVFNATLPYFGPKARMPMIYWRPRTPGGEIDMRAEPVMNTAEAWSKYLPKLGAPVGRIAYPTAHDTWGREPPWKGPGQQVLRQHFIDILLHELAHTQQSGRYPSKLQVEGGADAFAALTRDEVARRLNVDEGGRAAMPFMGGYGMLGQHFVGKYGPQQALFGQFGQRGRIPAPGPPSLPGLTRPGVRGLPRWAYQA